MNVTMNLKVTSEFEFEFFNPFTESEMRGGVFRAGLSGRTEPQSDKDGPEFMDCHSWRDLEL